MSGFRPRLGPNWACVAQTRTGRSRSVARLIAAGSGEKVVPESDYRALQNQFRELRRPLGKKMLEAEILKKRPNIATAQKTAAVASLAAEGRFPMKTVVDDRSLPF